MADRKRDACFSEDQEADECGSASKRRQVWKSTFENWQQRASNVDLASLSPGHTSAHSAISVLRCLQEV